MVSRQKLTRIMENSVPRPPYLQALGSFIFFSRWLQAPLYIGLVVAQGVYVYRFFEELIHLVRGTPQLEEADLLIMVLKLVDVVMIANLLVMVIVGGYETFVSRLKLRGHPDEPEWLSHVNAGALKVKLATALIGISSIQLLTSFVELGHPKSLNDLTSSGQIPLNQDLLWQVVIHLTFVVSALLLAVTDRITVLTAEKAKSHSL